MLLMLDIIMPPLFLVHPPSRVPESDQFIKHAGDSCIASEIIITLIIIAHFHFALYHRRALNALPQT